MRSVLTFAALSICLAGLGCRSAEVTATVMNQRSTPLGLIEVDYPSASFGVQALAPGERYQYRFKVIGTGPMSVLWSEGGQDQKRNSGPVLREGDNGTVDVTFTSAPNPSWNVKLTNRAIR